MATCTTHNSRNQSLGNLRFLPLGIAAVVLKSSAQLLAQDSITVAWDPPEKTDNIASYNVHYGQKSKSYDQQINAGLATEMKINNLSSGSIYYISATSQGFMGLNSDYADELIVVTNRDFKAASKSSGTITVDWEPGSQSAEKTNTRIYFRNDSETDTYCMEIPHSHNKVTIKGLRPAELYHVTTSQVDPVSGEESRLRAGKSIIVSWNGSGMEGFVVEHSSAWKTDKTIKLQEVSIPESQMPKIQISPAADNYVSLLLTGTAGEKVILQQSHDLTSFFTLYVFEIPSSGKQQFLMPMIKDKSFFRAVIENK